jgi:desulfoferrodoxin (superoxide reductase-like protein)
MQWRGTGHQLNIALQTISPDVADRYLKFLPIIRHKLRVIKRETGTIKHPNVENYFIAVVARVKTTKLLLTSCDK